MFVTPCRLTGPFGIRYRAGIPKQLSPGMHDEIGRDGKLGRFDIFLIELIASRV
jgi:hypothetical protein